MSFPTYDTAAAIRFLRGTRLDAPLRINTDVEEHSTLRGTTESSTSRDMDDTNASVISSPPVDTSTGLPDLSEDTEAITNVIATTGLPKQTEN